MTTSQLLLRTTYEVNGSDAAQIGWVEVAAEDGTNGYLWYLKSEGETRLRFQDYLEMAVVEGEKKGVQMLAGDLLLQVPVGGTEGLFAAITARGNVYQNYASGSVDPSGAGGKEVL